MRAISKISSRTFFIGIHTCHRRVYFLWIVLFCTLVQSFIYFFQSVQTVLEIFGVHVKFIFWIFKLRTIYNLVILRSTSEEHIWPPAVTFSMLIFELREFKDELNFLCTASFLCCLNHFLSWLWYFAMNAPWLRKKFFLCISYWIIQIQVINV